MLLYNRSPINIAGIRVPTIIVPKVIEPIDQHRRLVFLAGPIRGGGDWQSTMAEHLIAIDPNVQIACPCRWKSTHTLSPHFVRPFTDATNRQLHWERHYMDMAAMSPDVRGCVLFWLGAEDKERPHPGPEPYAMDTRREIGKFTMLLKHKGARVVVGGSPDFHGLSVIRDELDDAAGVPFPYHLSVQGAAQAAMG